MTKQPVSSEVDERFQVLENKVLYQDRTIEALNEVVTRQQNQIDRLDAGFGRLRDLLEKPAEAGVEDDDGPPPHY